MGASSNYYQLLGVSPTATAEEIKKAYRKLALKYHPDRNNGNQQTALIFIQLTEAYDTLTNPYKRILYDDSLTQASIAPLPSNPYKDHKYPPPRPPFERRPEQPVGWKPYAIVFGVFALIVLLSVLLMPEQPEETLQPGVYSVVDEQGNVLFDSNNPEDIRDFLQQQKSQNPELYRQLDSLINDK